MRRKKITVDDADENWLNFIINLLNLNRNLKWNFRFFEEKKLNVNERKLSTKYVGNLKINISSDSSTHQQKAAKIKRN